MLLSQSLFEPRLVQAGLVDAAALASARERAGRDHLELVDAVVATGLVDEDRAYSVLADSLGIALVSLDGMQTGELAKRLVPERLARRYLAVPLSLDDHKLTYATCRPFDLEANRDLSFASGRRAEAVLATPTAILQALDRLYPRVQDLDRLVGQLRTAYVGVELADPGATGAAGESPIIDFCQQLIVRAVEVGASDVHIEVRDTGAGVRYRICGVLEPVLDLPAGASGSVSNRFKIMARADISVKNRPQDGAFKVKVGGRPVDVRLSTMPTLTGEKIVMRVIDMENTPKGLGDLGYDADTLARFERCLDRPDGLVLVTGPTGSGKTTALYAALERLCTGATNIVTVEDPVERTVRGVSQVPVNVRAGNSFAAILKSLLRQDPNVIMVGEVRDEEVAQIVGQAAYTGHLVLTSLHTTDAATAITRLMNLGLEPFKVAESLAGVLAQRLIRRLCPKCKQIYPPHEARRRGQIHRLSAIPAGAGDGCETCKHTGYAGRMPIAELLTPSQALRSTIAKGATAHQIRLGMRAAGLVSMRERALELVVAGITSIEEVNRVLASDEDPLPATGSQRRVLVAEDESITRMLVKLLLEREQFEVLEASNGQEAVNIAVREHPDLLLLDLNMPTMDGYETIRRLRADLSLSGMPILVLTAEHGPNAERRVLDLGADDYVLKPFDPGVLMARVQAAFRRLDAKVA